MAGTRLTPTLLDKLTADLDLDGAPSVEGVSALPGGVARLERFSEQAVKAGVRRELNWLFNTNRLGSVDDLSAYPQVQTSVLNYGVPDLAGKTGGRRLLLARAKELRDAILAFEPRLNPRTLSVEVAESAERENAITFVVRGDIVGAVQAVLVQYKTDVEVDTGAATVRG
jgi:type VI secretion system protein ImpF